MQLTIESDASYLSVSKARSRAAGYFYLSSHSKPTNNGAIHVFCHVMREVVSSAAEAELGALFNNSKEACPLQIALEEISHPQSPTALITDNPTTSGIANDTVKQRRSKTMDMHFSWILDRIQQGHFTGQVYSDQTKGFLNSSSTGNNYLLLVYNANSNIILARPMPTCTGICIPHAYKAIHAFLTTTSLQPKQQQLDNRSSTIHEQDMSSEGTDN
jgi:hypothetical protein